MDTELDIYKKCCWGAPLFSSLHLSTRLKLETPSIPESSSVNIDNNQFILQQFLKMVCLLYLLFHDLLCLDHYCNSSSIGIYYLLFFYRVGLLEHKIQTLNPFNCSSMTTDDVTVLSCHSRILVRPEASFIPVILPIYSSILYPLFICTQGPTLHN